MERGAPQSLLLSESGKVLCCQLLGEGVLERGLKPGGKFREAWSSTLGGGFRYSLISMVCHPTDMAFFLVSQKVVT